MPDLAHNAALPATEVQIQLRQVVKDFGRNRVIDHLDLSIPQGQKVALIGPSGSGKSTVLRLIKGLESYQQGRIEVAGEAVPAQASRWRWPGSRKAPVIHRVGMVFQQFNLFPHLTVQENITEAPLRVLRLARDEALERAHQYLRLVGLAHKADAYPSQLSGGQQQRVAIARALAMRPQIMLFDEVTSALDPELVGEVLAVIRSIAHEFQMTMLLVTHEMKFAQDIADRVLFVEGGRIVADGSASEILLNPENERTRRFLQLVEQR
ncbi:amino acid ABC transporter ATP-binding protein [Pseudomonas cannabina]|uniref:Amino acid ABC transporter ATP-binding protein n=1 Tax=Pseudomonas cannabina TaxID=86840 RepID=A0A0P9M3B6_PSECA|nr:amino acid ABC transporter ATP-binding protein [Pseudomonas cannabina]KAA8715925.1 amino acid ABC transporter ATP-binding protein [Pseudomonas cannabina]KPW77753.1 Amino acid ABC transporter ATP-binding protein [Pseudomonas cannabina]SDQ84957.1 amino acid ABC transporter ATP-binding protein, PAAT family [Pseudomonas cannabina]